MSFSRYTPTRVLTPDDDEVVEDSEPEREEKKRTMVKKFSQKKTRTKTKPVDVIELSSDDSLPPNPILDRSHMAPIVIDISDGPEDATVDKGIQEELFALNKARSQILLNPPPVTTQVIALTEKQLSPSPHHEVNIDSDGRPILNLDRFAFSNPSKPTISRKPSQSFINSPSPVPSQSTGPKPPAKKAVATRKPSYSVDFENLDITNLRKCVCCDLAWTARKTDAQKMKHIQSCGKKNNWSADIVRVLITKELGNSAKSSIEGVQPLPTTLLAEVANEDPPRKKSRTKKPPLETIKSLVDTRNDILARARFLLDNESPVAGPSKPAADPKPIKVQQTPQTFGTSKLAARFGGLPLEMQETDASKVYDPTMSFPNYPQSDSSRSASPASPPPVRSTLAQRFATTSRMLEEDLITSEPYAPPSTFPVRPRLHDYSDHEVDEDEGAKISNTNPKPASLHCSSSVNAHLPSPPSAVRSPGDVASPQQTSHFSPKEAHKGPRREPSFVADPEFGQEQADAFYEDDWNDNGVYLHYDPDEEFQAGSSRDLEIQMQHTPKRPHPEPLRGLLEKLDLPYAFPNPTIVPIDANPELPKSTPSPKPIKRRGPGKKSKTAEKAVAKPKDISDEELFTKLRDSILNDVKLHHRVLRYEPVHFDVFLQYALDLGVPCRGLKLRVRAFLDSQAIHFYGLDPSGRRTKKWDA